MKLTSLFVHSFVGFSLLVVNDVTKVTAQRRPTKLPTAQPTTRLPTHKPTRRPTKEPTLQPTKTPTRQPTKKPTRSPTQKPTRSPTQKPTRSPTKKPTHRPTKVPNFGSSKTPTQKPTLFPSTLPITSPSTPPSASPLVLPPSQLPTAKPTQSTFASPSAKPTTQPSQSPTAKPTAQPSPSPTAKPSPSPTAKPSQLPTAKPSLSPTAKPLLSPTAKPTTQPSPSPTTMPSPSPTAQPSPSPTAKPSQLPTAKPSQSPTAKPTTQPSPSPTTKPSPSPTTKPLQSPTAKPSQSPTAKPTQSPTAKPTQSPSASPLAKPTAQPSQSPTAKPTPLPTAKPLAKPTTQPSPSPTAKPTQSPTVKPSPSPTAKPSTRPTASPTAKPTANPTGAPTAFPSVCTLDHYARPSFAYDACDSSRNLVGSMCYSKCPSNYYRDPDDSYQCLHNPILGCPYNDASYSQTYCFLESSNVCSFDFNYPWGVGYPWQSGNPVFDLTNAQIRCKNDHPHGCEDFDSIYYPKCAPGYHNSACCVYQRDNDICTPYGLTSIVTNGFQCCIPANITASSGSLPTQCNSKQQQIGNLCYGSCSPGYTADNVNCLSAPPLGWVQCGQFAAKDSSTCSSYDKSKTYPTCSSLSLPAAPIGSQRYTMLDNSQVSVNGVVGSLTESGLVTCGLFGASSSLTIFANLVLGAYYEAVIQDNANFVVYKHDGSGNSSPIFDTGTARSVDNTAYYGVFPDFPLQSGILAIFDTSNGGQTIWTSTPYAINLGSATVGLSMQQDGNLVQYAFYPDGSCDAIWNSGLPIFNLSPTGQVVWPHYF